MIQWWDCIALFYDMSTPDYSVAPFPEQRHSKNSTHSALGPRWAQCMIHKQNHRYSSRRYYAWFAWLSFQSFYGRPAYDATCEVSIYIAPSERGKGLGKEMLQYAIDISGALGIKTLLGFIFSHNEPSLKLFTHFGFETWGQFPNVAVLDGFERSVTILGKRVQK